MSKFTCRNLFPAKAAWKLFLGTLTAVACLAPLAPAQEDAPKVEGEMLVRFRSANPRVLPPGATPDSGLRLKLQSVLPGANVEQTYANVGWSLVKVPGGFGTDAAIARLSSILGPDNVVPNHLLHINATPNDPGYVSQWYLPKIGAPAAWAKTTGSKNVIVAVIDSGVSLNHPDLKNNLWKNTQEIPGNGIDDDHNGYIDDYDGLNTVAGERGTPPEDEQGHGSHCSGSIGAVGNNATGSTGVNWNVRILPVKFIDGSGNGPVSGAIEGLNYLIALKKRGENIVVTSNSYGGTTLDPALQAAFAAAGQAGLLNICAAGNGDAQRNPINIDAHPQYPACFNNDSIVAVGATDSSDNQAYFSNFGANNVDLAAPGVSIYGLNRSGGTAIMSGTSMATAITAGAAALLWGYQSNLTAAQVKARLLSTADKVAGWSGKSVSGGRLNLARLLSETGGSPTPTPVPTPTPTSRTIFGQVYRLNNGSIVPLVGAKVQLTSNVYDYSDQNGNYSFSNVKVGTYTMSAKLTSYSFKSARVYVRTDSASQIRQDFASSTTKSYYTISGYALAPGGVPTAGVQIFLTGVPKPVALTNSAGFYAINDRGAATYSLSAQGAGRTWTPTLSSVKLPTSNIAGSPNARVDFGVREGNAPQLNFVNPASNSVTILSTSLQASGNASDDTNLASLSYKLARITNGKTYYYTWKTHKWGTSSSSSSLTNTIALNGTTANWSITLPNDIAGTYTLTLIASDVWGNKTTTAKTWTTGLSSAASSAQTF